MTKHKNVDLANEMTCLLSNSMLRLFVIRYIIIQHSWHASAFRKGVVCKCFLQLIFCPFGINLNKILSDQLDHGSVRYL